jgi:hypothetical protein
MRFDRKTAGMCVALGLAITALSSLLANTQVIGEFPDVLFISIPMIGMSYWGLPLPWLKVVDYPGAAFEVIGVHLVFDSVFWSAVFFLAAFGHGKLQDLKASRNNSVRLKLVNRKSLRPRRSAGRHHIPSKKGKSRPKRK